jgi:hypothetical protein
MKKLFISILALASGFSAFAGSEISYFEVADFGRSKPVWEISAYGFEIKAARAATLVTKWKRDESGCRDGEEDLACGITTPLQVEPVVEVLVSYQLRDQESESSGPEDLRFNFKKNEVSAEIWAQLVASAKAPIDLLGEGKRRNKHLADSLFSLQMSLAKYDVTTEIGPDYCEEDEFGNPGTWCNPARVKKYQKATVAYPMVSVKLKTR